MHANTNSNISGVYRVRSRDEVAILLLLACTDGALTVNNTAPEVTITRPTSAEQVLDADAVVLEATVHDSQTANHELRYVVSDPSGEVDVEPEHLEDDVVRFALPALTPGAHTWTVLAIDPKAASGEDSVVFDVINGDADGDGSIDAALGGDDCDDTDADVGPAADERCNGEDDDCDGMIDEDAVDPATWYLDVDGDTYGDPDNVMIACTPPEGVVTDATDCNDADAAIHPDADELCNGFDDDCDGTIDEDAMDAYGWYTDDDGDGYGAGTATAWSCEPPTDGVATNDDCDDGDVAIYPGAEEICENGIDEDCDGVPDDLCPEEHCGYVTTDETWAGGVTHVLTCNVVVGGASAPTLTVEDGAIVAFDGLYGIYVAQGDPGRMVAGEARFTSNVSGAGPGEWLGLLFGSYDTGSSITGALVEFGGGNGEGAIYAYYGGVSLDDVVVWESAAAGVAGLYADLSVVNSLFSGNVGDGISLVGASTLTFSSNGFLGNGGAPVRLPADVVGALDAGSTYAGNTEDYATVTGGYVTTDATWPALDVPYRVLADVEVASSTGPTLTIEPGAELQFEAGAGMTIGQGNPGALSAEGTSSSPIVFTAVTTGWDGLTCGASATDFLVSDAEIAYGGGNGYGALYFYYCDGSIADSTVRDSATWGIYRNGGSPTVSGVTYSGNTSGNLY